MKTKFSIYPMLLLVGLLFAACQDENDLIPSPNLELPSEMLVADDSAAPAPNARFGCKLVLVPGIFQFNSIRNSFGGCSNRYMSICYRPGRVVSIPCIPRLIPKPLPPDVCLKCPRDIDKFFPADLFEDFRKLNPEIAKIEANGVTFPISNSIIGIQFFAENEIINRKGFILKNSLSLSVEEQKALGVSGKIIPAGQYPVVHNLKNNTFNTIVAVK